MKHEHNLAEEILALEKRYWQAMIDQDIDEAWSLTNDPCLVAGSNGVMKVNRKDFVSMMKNADWVLNKFEISDAKIEVINQDTVVLAYKVKEDIARNGRPETIIANEASTWVRNNDSWLCALHTEAKAA